MIEVNFSFVCFSPTLIPLSSVNVFKGRKRTVQRSLGIVCVLGCFLKKNKALCPVHIVQQRDRMQDWWYNYL